MMRYLCRPGGQHDAVNSGTGLETQRGKWDKWSDPASTRLCPLSQHRAECGGGTQSQSVGRGAGCTHRKAASLLGLRGQGRDLLLGIIPYPRRQ